MPIFFQTESELLDWMASKTRQAAELGGALGRWTAAGLKIVTPEQFSARLEICQKCPEWNPEGFAGTGKCNLCGCSTQAKLRMETSFCPVGKWQAVLVDAGPSS